MRVYDLSIAAALAFHFTPGSHLAAFALNAEHAVKVFDRLALSPLPPQATTDARVFYVLLCQCAFVVMFVLS